MRDKWHIVHDYRRLENLGVVPVIGCVVCHEPLWVGIAEGDIPSYRCYNCNVVTILGLNDYEKMEEFINGTRRDASFNL